MATARVQGAEAQVEALDSDASATDACCGHRSREMERRSRFDARLRYLDRGYGDEPGARGGDHAARCPRRQPWSIAPLPNQLQELALSPDGRKVAFTVHGEIFSASAQGGIGVGDAVRVSGDGREEAEIRWAPDSRHLAYMSDRNGTNQLFV